MWKSFNRNKGKIAGGLTGLAAAFLLIFAWPIILIIFMVIIGVFLGEIFDIFRRVQNRVEEIFPKKTSEKKSKDEPN
ncbi:DUF2273 domain-containing protein [Candidatus Aerophobetes bacterium]|nr:DUF2273 domain-containing protein [Candidatus Aerophobetes bacterium]